MEEKQRFKIQLCLSCYAFNAIPYHVIYTERNYERYFGELLLNIKKHRTGLKMLKYKT